jgi:UDP-glucose 4-epimerase
MKFIHIYKINHITYGKYLVRSLLENGNSVTIFDNFSNSTKDSVSSLVDIDAKIVVVNITKPQDTLNAVKDLGYSPKFELR